MNRRNIFVILTALAILVVSAVVIFLARGYQIDIKNAAIAPTGILVATSDPDGAEVWINGKLTTATNNTINLPPGKYLVKIKRDGFSSWEKTVTIKAEEVFKTGVFLFPNLPELRPLTLSGATNPVLSPDGAKIAYFVASSSAEKNGLWILDMGRSDLPSNFFSPANSRLIYQNSLILSLSDAKLLWSPDSKQILAVASPSATAYLLDTDRINESLVPAANLLPATLLGWEQLETARYQAQVSKLNPKLFTILATSSAKLAFSPDENKIFYQATASASLPPILAAYLPGSNPTPEIRAIKPGNSYVYDIKEDKNYEIEKCQPKADPSRTDKIKNEKCVWFPSSRHLLDYNDKEISIMEYDGTNRSVIYAGPFTPNIVYPWPNWGKIVVLTSLNDTLGVNDNLYTINLR